jgi:hypothetical protein
MMTAADSYWAEGHAEHREAFTQSLLDRGDDLGAVVRAQVFVEYYLQAGIESALKDPTALGSRAWSDYLGFEPRLRIFRALGGELSDDLCKRMRKLAETRNRLAHNIGASLPEQDARAFMSLMNATQNLVLTGMSQETNWQRAFRIALWIHVVDVRFASLVLKRRYDHLRPMIAEQFQTYQVILNAESLAAGMPFGLFAGDDDKNN